MAHSNRGSDKADFSYMDGVPVKISEKYKPPRRVVLPAGFRYHVPQDLLMDEYNFALEHSVLEKIKEWREIKKNQADNRRQRIEERETQQQQKLVESYKKLNIEAKGEAGMSTQEGNISTDSPNVAVPTTVESVVSDMQPIGNKETPFLPCSASVDASSYTNTSNIREQNVETVLKTQPYSGSSILTPTPISQTLENKIITQYSTAINISDFESDTSSPFDNMELKTINEMEELAHVLQPVPENPHVPNEGDDHSTLRQFQGTQTMFQPKQHSVQCNTNIKYQSYESHNLIHEKNMIVPPLNGITAYNVYRSVPLTYNQHNDTAYMNKTSSDQTFGYPVSSSQGGETHSSMYRNYSNQVWNPLYNSSSSSNSGEKPSNTYTLNPGVVSSFGTIDAASVEDSVHPLPNLLRSTDTSSFDVSRISGGEKSNFSSPLRSIHHNVDYRNNCSSQQSLEKLNGTMTFPHSADDPSVSTSDEKPSLRSSRSVPDIVKELDNEVSRVKASCTSRQNSHTPPPRPNSFGSSGLEDWKPWPSLDSPSHQHGPSERSVTIQNRFLPNRGKAGHEQSQLEDPFSSLPHDAQSLVVHISEMGFPRPRVARACKYLGKDSKKIVEFLIQVQTLEEKNYPSDRVEIAVMLNDYNMGRAEKYLTYLDQLVDLGFSEEKVSEALVKCDNDRDKALDYLMA